MAAITLASAACDTSTAPETAPTLDTEAALADYDALASAFGSDEWAGFRALSGRTPFAATPAALEAVAALAEAGSPEGAHDFALRLTTALTAAEDAPRRGPIISGWHRGSTFVYDPDSDEWVPDLDREGAPATGVRFVLYATDEQGYPVLEEERGWADLIDEGDTSVEDIALRLVVTFDGHTALDYRTTLDHDATSGALTVAGFYSGPLTRLDFDVAVAASGLGSAPTIDVDFEMQVAARGFAITGSVRGAQEGSTEGTGSIMLDVRHRTDTLALQVTGVSGTLDGSIHLNGRLFATVAGPGSDPDFLSADGDPLRPGEVLVLLRVVDAVEDVFDLLEDLLDPVDELVLLGFIL